MDRVQDKPSDSGGLIGSFFELPVPAQPPRQNVDDNTSVNHSNRARIWRQRGQGPELRQSKYKYPEERAS
jgi:hypothetical protein